MHPYRHLVFSVTLVFTASLVSAQKTTLNGSVTDARTGEPLIGATLISKADPNLGTAAEIDGSFALYVEKNDTLLVSYTGYEPQTVAVAGRNSLKIKLLEAANELNEVVVTAFGIERQEREIGYATQSLKGDEVVKSNSHNVLNALSGKVAGLQVINSNGVEGGTTRIVSRGASSITGNNQPLIIVDGVILENDPGWTSVEAGRDWGSAINNINPSDIEEMTFLKGAAAAALYGVRGSNGAIIISLKKGRERSGIGIEYNYSMRMVKPFYWREVQNQFGFGAPLSLDVPALEQDSNGVYLHPTQLYTDNGPGGVSSSASFGAYASSQSWGAPLDGRMVRWWDGEMRPWAPQPNNFDHFFRTGVVQKHNISFSGGGKMGTLRASFTREDNKSVALNSNYDQTTAYLGARLEVSKRIKSDVSISYINFHRLNSPVLGSDNNSFGKIMVYGYPRSYQGENLNYEEADGTKHDFGSNPFQWGNIDVFWSVFNQNTELFRNKVIGSIGVTYEITHWLTASGRLGTDLTFDEFESRNKPTDISGTLGGGYAHSLAKDNVQNNDFTLTADKGFLSDRLKSSLSIGGAQYRRKQYNIAGANYTQWRDPFLYNFGNTIGQPVGIGEGRYERRLNSLYSFLKFNWQDYLFLETTLRNDWSSTLSKANNSYRFPSANISFLPSEAFDWKNKALSYSKLRIAFAETAQDGEPYQLETVYFTGSFANQSTGYTDYRVRPANLFPQRTRSYEAGVEIGLWGDRLTLDFTAYYSRSFNQLLDAPIPVSSGYPIVRINTGVLSNRGIEGIIQARVLTRGGFTWRTGFNLARNQNRLDQLADGADILNLAGIWGDNGPSVSVKAGEPYGIITGFDYQRDEATGKPLVNDAGTHYLLTPVKVPIRIFDDNGKFVRYANSTPKFIGGWHNTLTFKGFTLYTLIDAKVGGDIWAGSYAVGLQSGHSPSTLKERTGGGLPWTDENGVTRNDGVLLDGVYEDGTPNEKVVHYYYKYFAQGGWGRVATTPGVFENTWIKLREISLTYDLPKAWNGKVFQRLTISLTARDLAWLYTTLPDRINPEGANGSGNAQGIEFGALPGMRSFGVTLGAGF